jgi:DNA-binding MarR family transcriptional regulator
MPEQSDHAEIAVALQVSIGLLLRRLQHASPLDDLSMPGISALAHIERAGSATLSSLARAERITPQAMGATASALAGRGLVERGPDPDDGRKIVISLTDAGRRAMRGQGSARTGQVAKILADSFTTEELEVLIAAVPLLQRISERLYAPTAPASGCVREAGVSAGGSP